MTAQAPSGDDAAGNQAPAGVPGLGSNTATFENARADAQPEFIHLNLDVTQTERLWHGVEISQHLVGQVADGPLVSSEQFAAGGFTSVRGYLQSEVVGDEGLTGSLEIVSPHEYDAMAEDFERKEHKLFGGDGFEMMVQRVAGLEQSIGINDLTQFTPR